MRGVVLEGGGSKGSYQVGALLALHKYGIKFDVAVGTSIGSVNAAFVALDDYTNLYNLWKTASVKNMFNIDEVIIDKLKNKKFDKEFFKMGAAAFNNIIGNKGMDVSYFRDFVRANIDEKKLQESNIDFGLVTFNLSDFKPVQIFKKDIPEGKLHDYIMASCFFPTFKSEKIIDNKYYIDGGFYDNCPVDMLVDKGFDEIYVIRTLGIGFNRKVKVNGQKLIYIAPHKKLAPTLMVHPDISKYNMNLGYYDALRVLKNLDGENYYFKFKNNKFYEKMLSDFSEKEIIKLSFDFMTRNKKKIVLRLVEKLASEYDIDNFSIYSLRLFIIKLRLKVNKNNKYYKYLKKININFF